MPRNREEYVYLSVPIRKDSRVYAHLKEEVQRQRGKKCPQIGPYVAALLEERDRHLHGEGEGQGLWLSSHLASLTELIEKTVQKAIVSALPSLSLMLTQTQPTPTSVAQSPEEAIEREAAAMAASLASGGWGCDDE